MNEGFEVLTTISGPWTHTAPGVADIARAWNEGRDAAAKGQHFKNDCPYTYDKFKGMGYAEFNATQRPLMNEWFKAWQGYRDGSTRAA